MAFLVTTMEFPTFNLKKFEKSKGVQRQKFSVQLDSICRETGFLILDGHGVPKEIIEALVTAKDIYINKFNENTIYYEISIFGNINSLISEVSSNNFLQIKDISVENSSINLSFIK